VTRSDGDDDGDERDGVDDARTGPVDGATAEGRDGGDVPALLLLVGVGLFVFPEPVTSYVGATLAAIGALAWFVRFALE
jgi:hypothetical protein